MNAHAPRPSNRADYSALDETLEIMAPMGPDLSNGFSNHAPMAIEAMCAMGRGDAVMPWFESYRRSLMPRMRGKVRLRCTRRSARAQTYRASARPGSGAR